MYSGRGGGGGKVERSERLSWWGGGGCLLTGLGGGVEDSLLVLFHKERLVSILPENNCDERSVPPWLQYARGAC